MPFMQWDKAAFGTRSRLSLESLQPRCVGTRTLPVMLLQSLPRAGILTYIHANLGREHTADKSGHIPVVKNSLGLCLFSFCTMARDCPLGSRR
jgi:hypothetical protein